MKCALLLFFVAASAALALSGCASPDQPWLYRNDDDLPPTSTSDRHLKWWEEK